MLIWVKKNNFKIAARFIVSCETWVFLRVNWRVRDINDFLINSFNWFNLTIIKRFNFFCVSNGNFTTKVKRKALETNWCYAYQIVSPLQFFLIKNLNRY